MTMGRTPSFCCIWITGSILDFQPEYESRPEGYYDYMTSLGKYEKREHTNDRPQSGLQTSITETVLIWRKESPFLYSLKKKFSGRDIGQTQLLRCSCNWLMLKVRFILYWSGTKPIGLGGTWYVGERFDRSGFYLPVQWLTRLFRGKFDWSRIPVFHGD